MKRYKNYKQFFDFLFSFILIILLFPVFILIGLAVFIFMGRPIFFTQDRPGINNKIFRIYKFRTMRLTLRNENITNTDENRLNKFGSILRSTSLDEIPSLINIIKGDMSFVGPRPLLVEYLELYDKFQLKRHKVLPGLTGLSQISGRNNLSWKERFEKDVFYVENYNFFMDIKILFLTIWKVLSKDGINSKGSRTCKPFEGNK